MAKKSKEGLDQPVTQKQWAEGMKLLEGLLAKIIRRQDNAELEQKLNWQEQRQFNKEISQKADATTKAVKALDKRVRYQDDMPERLEQVENQQYELTRRVAVLEKRK